MNIWFDLVVFGLFTFGVVFVGIPFSLYLLKKGVKGFREYGFRKLPSNFLAAPGLGTYSIEITGYGVLIFSFAVWYLFIDEGGQLLNFINEAKNFLAP